jgi:hypothetical protein
MRAGNWGCDRPERTRRNLSLALLAVRCGRRWDERREIGSSHALDGPGEKRFVMVRPVLECPQPGW